MTPGARVAAAIEILDTINTNIAPEKALTGWARGHRFAGSKDRAAIRDHVFGALRCRRSFAAIGGAESGRGLMIGALRASGVDPATIFDAVGYAPPTLSDAEHASGRRPEPGGAEAVDCPDWLWPRLTQAYGAQAPSIMAQLQTRAQVHVRANVRKVTRQEAQDLLLEEGVATRASELSPTALEITDGARRLRGAASYVNGLVELQDAGSQALSDAVPLKSGQRLLDYCAGGGGKTLAIAARVDGRFFAHDAFPRRMADLPARAERAGVQITQVTTAQIAQSGPYDTVLADVPCSGSGSWRRDPGAKWSLDEAELARLVALQSSILDSAAAQVGHGGHLVYATCSLLAEENSDQIASFRARAPQWNLVTESQLSPTDNSDGFYWAVLEKS